MWQLRVLHQYRVTVHGHDSSFLICLACATSLRRYMLICDEAHYMQNLAAKRTKAALELAEGAEAVILATGTPVLSRSCRAFSAGQ